MALIADIDVVLVHRRHARHWNSARASGPGASSLASAARGRFTVVTHDRRGWHGGAEKCDLRATSCAFGIVVARAESA
ncbi:MAG TPA: hypothetical protein VGI66_13740 [Streptosporangiaceae bacterium]|jgi:hypothetical protein